MKLTMTGVLLLFVILFATGCSKEENTDSSDVNTIIDTTSNTETSTPSIPIIAGDSTPPKPPSL